MKGYGEAMKKIILALLLGVATSMSVQAQQFCPNCIYNSAAPQNAQMNIGTATIRGTLTVGQLNLTKISASTGTFSVVIASGQFITDLNASQLLLGTLPSARVAGAYSGITGVGTIASGVWNGSAIPTANGGWGKDVSTLPAGTLPYFSATGVLSGLPSGSAGQLLQTNGSSTPTWTGAPQVLGTNITAIPLLNLSAGLLPTTIGVADASISSVAAAKIIGNISGNATNVTGIVQQSHIATGTLSVQIPASSVTATGVTPGFYGGPALLPLLEIGSDGRVYIASQSSFTIAASSLQAGTIPANVLVPANNVQPGTLKTGVVAVSIATSGVTAGAYGYAAQVSSFTVGADGRLTLAGNIPIALPLNQLNNGTLPAGVLVPAASIAGGTIPANVAASNLLPNGVTPGIYGALGNAVEITVGPDGRITAAAQHEIPSFSTNTAFVDVANTWVATQTFINIIAVNTNDNFLTVSGTSTFGGGAQFASSVTASAFFGDGRNLTNLPTTSFGGGTITNWAGFLSSVTVVGQLVGQSSITASSFFGDGSHLTGLLSTTTIATQFLPLTGGTLTGPLVINLPAGGASLQLSASGSFGPYMNLLGSTGHNLYMGAGLPFMSGATADDLSYRSYGGMYWGVNNSNTPSMTMDAEGNLILLSSMTASAFFGDGSHLTGVTTTPGNTVTSSFTVTGAGGILSRSSVTATAFFGDGSHLTGIPSGVLPSTVAYTSVSNTFTSSQTVNNALLAKSSVTASAFFGDGSHLSGLASGVCAAGLGSNSVLCLGLSNIAGGASATASGGQNNNASGNGSAIGGGLSNVAGNGYATIPGGYHNSAQGVTSFAAGSFAQAINNGAFVWADSLSLTGYVDHGANTFNISANGGVFIDSGNLTDVYGIVATTGTFTSSVTASSFFGDGSNLTGLACAFGGSSSVLCNATDNSVSGTHATVSGGFDNDAGGNYTTTSGGVFNTANGTYATVAGGKSNMSSGEGTFSVGENNTASNIYAVAMGQNAHATSQGSFVWGDSMASVYTDHGQDTFNLHATGGMFIDAGGLTSASTVTAPSLVLTGSGIALSTNAPLGTDPSGNVITQSPVLKYFYSDTTTAGEISAPSWVKVLHIHSCGAGGGGGGGWGGAIASTKGGAGGGGGACIDRVVLYDEVTWSGEGFILSFTIGAGGAGGSSGTVGQNGAATTVYLGTTNFVYAGGGGGGNLSTTKTGNCAGGGGGGSLSGGGGGSTTTATSFGGYPGFSAAQGLGEAGAGSATSGNGFQSEKGGAAGGACSASNGNSGGQSAYGGGGGGSGGGDTGSVGGVGGAVGIPTNTTPSATALAGGGASGGIPGANGMDGNRLFGGGGGGGGQVATSGAGAGGGNGGLCGGGGGGGGATQDVTAAGGTGGNGGGGCLYIEAY